MDFVSDNAGCLASGGAFPRDGYIMEFGSLHVYVATVREPQYLSPVLVAPDPPRSSSSRAVGSVEVMMAGVTGAGKAAAQEDAAPTKSGRTANPPTEREQNNVGTSTAAPPSTPLQAAMCVVGTPIAQNADVATERAELEAQRQALLTRAGDVIRAQQELNLTLREYNAAHGFASVSANPARIAINRLRGRNLEQDLRREVLTGKSVSVSLGPVENQSTAVRIRL
jgi:hypothetical protein